MCWDRGGGCIGIYGAGKGSHGVGCWGWGHFGVCGWVGLMWLWVAVGSVGQEMGRHHPLVGWVDVVMGRVGIYGAGEGSPSSVGGLG